MKIRRITFREYELNAPSWKAMGSAIAPTPEALALGAFAIVNGVALVYVG